MGGGFTMFIGGKPYGVSLPRPAADSEFLIQVCLSGLGGQRYTVTVDIDGHAHCDCPDFTFRRAQLDPAGCKHVQNLRDAGLLDLQWRKP